MINKKIKGAISVDVDSLSQFYYGIKNQEIKENDITYSRILPRILKFFKAKRIKATFFIVGKDIRNSRHKALLRRITNEGHELANHTFSHDLNFSSLSLVKKEGEIIRCEKLIERITSVKPVGFRVPGWNIDSETIKILEKRNYLYDSSIFPSFWYLVSWVVLFFKSGNMSRLKPLKNFKNIFAPLHPYYPRTNEIYRQGKRKIMEVPVNATPFLRIPFYGNFSLSFKSRFLFDLSLRKIRKAQIPLNYVLHAIEFYNHEDDAEEKIKRLSLAAITMPFKSKFKFYDYALAKFKENYNLLPIKDLIKKE